MDASTNRLTFTHVNFAFAFVNQPFVEVIAFFSWPHVQDQITPLQRVRGAVEREERQIILRGCLQGEAPSEEQFLIHS